MAKAKDNKAGKPAKSTVRSRAMNPQSQKRKRGSIKDYFKGVKLEMKKVVWPSRKQIVNNTLVVLATVLVIGIIIWVLDLIFQFGLFQFISK